MMAAHWWFIVLSFSLLLSVTEADNTTITPGHPLLDGNTLSPTTGFFQLGFFNPPGSTHRYLGIWYKNIPVQTVVWVANQEAPLINDSSGVLSLTADGNLSLSAGGGAALWSTGTSSLANPVVHLLDSGNLVLSDGYNGTKEWQSFDHPSNTMLPGMEIGRDPATNLDRRITSWKNASDPSPGEYSVGISIHAAPEVYTWNGSVPVTRSGPWDGYSWGGSGNLREGRQNAVTSYTSRGSGVFFSFEMVDKSVISRVVMEDSGGLRLLVWENQQWITFWQGQIAECDRYARCGMNEMCDSQYAQVCKCLPGFVTRSVNIRNSLASTKGCVRRAALSSCQAVGDGFRSIRAVKVPELSSATNDDGIESFDGCRERCLSNCSCTAFTFLRGSTGCISWFGDLVDVEQLPEGTGEELYLRLAASELPSSQPPAIDTAATGSKTHGRIILIVTLSTGLFVLVILLCFIWIRRHKRQGIRQVSQEQLHFKSGSDISITLGENEEGGMKFSLFHSTSIINATNNFSQENKLGEGGFGPVYKGRLQDGQEIAVKRLATYSGQGLEEFENEILLIAKLQHINLVRLLGCYIQEEEKMLIYEYMPNKSLDLYIFDLSRRKQLNWHMRFHIIEGIAQGLLYLHKHSRLRIIHRDLKASNILLDDNMNPKIADFGIARIFGSNATLEKTRRVVGTYGYMAPEYVVEGLFSIKSDVFSFGVVLLEIISGKRNTCIYQKGNSQNLLGYAWTLWKEDKWFDLVDASLEDPCDTSEIYRCIHVALMCVQESFDDRPTMTEVITMLSSENTSLPEPKEPGFFNLRITNREGLLENVSESFSVNELTITTIESR